MVIKIHCKSLSEYLGTLVAAIKVTTMGGFTIEDSAGWLENSDSGDKEESRGVTEGEATKKRS